MPVKLTLFPTQGTSRYFLFHEGKNHFVGRDTTSDLLMEDPRVSARHALFQWTGNNWILVDLRSKNGTFVNGAKVTEIPLQADDWISLGGLLAQFQRVSENEVARLSSERANRLQTFVERRRSLNGNLAARDFLRQLVESVLELIGAERGFVLLVDPAGEIDAEVAAGFPAFERLDERFQESFSAIEKVLTTGESVVTSNARAEVFGNKRRSVLELGIGALACVPLVGETLVTGLIYVDGRKKGGTFTEIDLEILEALADHAALVAASFPTEGPIRELIGTSESGAAGSRSFLEDLGDKVAPIARSAREPRPTE